MDVGLRVRVSWDGAVVEDRIYRRRRTVRIGAGARADTVVAGAADTRMHATLTRHGRGYELWVPPGAVDAIAFPGEEPIDARALTLPYRRLISETRSGGQLTVGDATVEFERVRFCEERRDRALWAYALASILLSTLMGGSYKLARLFGDGTRAQWGRPTDLNRIAAAAIRVRIGPDAPAGQGASRVQAGRGRELHGDPKAPVKLAARQDEVAHAKKKTTPKRIRGERPDFRGGDGDHTALAARPDGKQAAAKALEEQRRVEAKTKVARENDLSTAQNALLAADLRDAVDSFSRAAKNGPLDYDQKNWLGLAHYLQGDLADAEKVWKDARTSNPSRVDAVNNLASVAKRRNDLPAEVALLEEALSLAADDCHATNSMALALAKQGKRSEAEAMLIRSDAACGGNYAYTLIQRAAILSLFGSRDEALKFLEVGLAKVDTLVPVKEFEVWADLSLDPAFASIRGDARFQTMTTKYLPRAVAGRDPMATPQAQVAANPPLDAVPENQPSQAAPMQMPAPSLAE